MATNFHHPHNVVDADLANAQRPWGIRVTLPATDPLTRLLGNDWAGEHWYRTERERDRALAQMKTRHGYYRIGDEVSLNFEKIDR